MGKPKSNPNRKFVSRIAPLLRWYCAYCSKEFDTKKELNEHKCEVSKSY